MKLLGKTLFLFRQIAQGRGERLAVLLLEARTFLLEKRLGVLGFLLEPRGRIPRLLAQSLSLLLEKGIVMRLDFGFLFVNTLFKNLFEFELASGQETGLLKPPFRLLLFPGELGRRTFGFVPAG